MRVQFHEARGCLGLTELDEHGGSEVPVTSPKSMKIIL